jgi:o-succinylbenzoate---CoA ligase
MPRARGRSNPPRLNLVPQPLLPVDAPVGTEAVAGFIKQLEAALGGTGPPLLPLPPGLESLRDQLLDRAEPGNRLEFDDIALVVPTSGSTGIPKLAMLSRSALLASVTATHEELGGPGRWLLAVPTSHIAGLQVLGRSVVSGYPPVVMNLNDGFVIRDLIDSVQRLLNDIGPEPRYAALVPTQLRRVLDAGGVAVSALVALDAVLLGGSRAPEDLVTEAHEMGITLVRTYGMTETSAGCVYDGVPLPGLTVTIDDVQRICIAGPMVFSGYRNDPKLTAKVLRDGVFTTNDVGRIDDQGRLHVIGRSDDIIVSGGVNVSPSQVERVLLRHPHVISVTVVGIPDDEWGERVTAVCELSDLISLNELRDFARGSLPNAALPRKLVTVASVPQLSSGKPDRQSIAEFARKHK